MRTIWKLEYNQSPLPFFHMWYRDDFTAYANVCFHEFGNRVAHWTTVLEPNIMAQGSFDNGDLPPNHCSYPFGTSNCTVGNSTTEPYLFVHHSLLAHASTVRLYRQNYQVSSLLRFFSSEFYLWSWGNYVCYLIFDFRLHRRALLAWICTPCGSIHSQIQLKILKPQKE